MENRNTDKFIRMRYLITFALVVMSLSMFAQDIAVTKPSYVIVANDEIITEEKLGELMGIVKSMNKGVSQDLRDELADKHGSIIGEKEFIIIVELYDEKELHQKPEPAHIDNEVVDDLVLHINDEAKDFEVEMLDGKSIRLSELKGKVVLLNFWATWCGPCLMEFYEMPEKILKPFSDRDFVFLPIAKGEQKEKVSAKMLQLKQKGIDFNAGYDPEEKIWSAFAKQSIPKNFVIDKNGVIKYIATGNAEGNVEQLAREIRKLLDE